MQVVAALFAFLLPLFVVAVALYWTTRRRTPAFATIQNITLPAGPGLPAVGSILSVANFGSPMTYLAIGNAGNMKIGMKNKTADVTNQGTPWTQVIATLHDGGTFTCDLHFIPGSANTGSIEGHSFLTGIGALFNGNISNVASGLAPNCFWQLTWPNGVTIYFEGPIVDFPVDMNLEKDLMISMTIQVSGEPVWTSGS